VSSRFVAPIRFVSFRFILFQTKVFPPHDPHYSRRKGTKLFVPPCLALSSILLIGPFQIKPHHTGCMPRLQAVGREGNPIQCPENQDRPILLHDPHLRIQALLSELPRVSKMSFVVCCIVLYHTLFCLPLYLLWLSWFDNRGLEIDRTLAEQNHGFFSNTHSVIGKWRHSREFCRFCLSCLVR
jgi:hypothetical protein